MRRQHTEICRLFHVVTHTDTAFLYCFWERFKTFGVQPAQYDVVDMVEVGENGEVKVRQDRSYKLRAEK